MPKFSDTQTFPAATEFYSPTRPAALVSIDANGGSVAIEQDMGDGTWIALPDSPYSADTVFHLEVAQGRFRFTPSGSATYSFTV